MHLQLSFLGRVPGKRGEYVEAVYRFPGGGGDFSTSFFGEALRRRAKPDRLVVLGTSGSMWQVLLEIAGVAEAHERVWQALAEACEKNRVDQGHLDQLAGALAPAFGCEVRCRLLPYGRTPEEQRAFVRLLAEEVPEEARLTLDVTHGLRHLAMLMLVAALYLRRVKRVDVAALYYGAFDMPRDKGAPVPVLDLAGLLAVTAWIEALAIFDHSGDYAPFAGLYEGDGAPQGTARLLREAAFFEHTTNPVKATAKLTTLHQKRDQLDTPVGGLFSNALMERIAWFRRPSRAERERELAHAYLARGDFLRAALYGQEAYLSQEVAAGGGKVDDYGDREQARESATAPPFRKLKRIRNALAHGLRPDDHEAQRIVQGAGYLESALKDCLDALLPRRQE
jgi:CRISPR-associated Csx2 family protein